MAEVIVYPIHNDDKKEKFIGDYLILFYNPFNLDTSLENMTIGGQTKDEDYLIQLPIIDPGPLN